MLNPAKSFNSIHLSYHFKNDVYTYLVNQLFQN